MTVYSYLHADEFKNIQEVGAAIQSYAKTANLKINKVLEETNPSRSNWQAGEPGRLLLENRAQPGDVIIAYEAPDLARSTCQLLELLLEATAKQVDIHFTKYGEVFRAQKTNKLADLLRIMQHIESDFISRRTTDALARRRAAGLPLGRPKGRKNKSLKLDKSRKDILRYLDLGISKASIAKLVKCHPQTLYDWIDRHNVPVSRKPRKSRKAITSSTMMQEA